MTQAACRICGAAALRQPFSAREMLHGTRETFDYAECGACGCVQILSIPEDLSRFYPSDYFSFRTFRSLDGNLVRRLLDPKRVRASFGDWSLLGWLTEKISRPFDYVDWIRAAGLGPDARVLDVGCGGGKTLLAMALGGFPNPQGVDPFIAKDIHYPGSGVTVRRQSLETFAEGKDGAFDFVMFHHALEHLVDPVSSLSAARRLLSPRGRILLALPVAGSWAWEAYRETWCNLDAPRHLHLLTEPSMAILAGRSGLKVRESRSVGGLSQFTGSERYRRDIPANDPRKDKDLFTPSQLRSWRKRTREINAEGRGDQRLFWLAPA